MRETRECQAEHAARVEHDLPGTTYDGGMPGLRLSAAEAAGTPVYLTPDQAEVAAAQFRETAAYRGWSLLALAVMRNHFHAVVRVPGDPEPRRLLTDLKAYGTRALDARFGERPRWWTRGGSKRKLPDALAVARGVRYVLHKQWCPLVTWPPGEDPGEPRA